MSSSGVAHEIQPGETYQIDSSEYDSEEERDGLGEDEYDRLVDEGESQVFQDLQRPWDRRTTRS